jgi:hypothetical protein
MAQNQILVVTEIKPERAEALKTLLQEMAKNVNDNISIPFAKFSEIHFASLFVLDNDAQYQPLLILEGNVDGEPESFVDHLLQLARAGIDSIFSCCVDYPGPAAGDEVIKAYLLANSKIANAYYRGHRMTPVDSVQKESLLLRPALERFLDNHYNEFSTRSPASVFASIRQYIDANPLLAWARTGESVDAQNAADDLLAQKIVRNGIAAGVGAFLAIIVGSLVNFGLTLAVLGCGIVLPLAAFILLLRIHEIRDLEDKQLQPESAHLNELLQMEDHQGQNHLTVISTVKPGIFRLLTLKTVLWAINELARFYFTKGKLGNLTTIHFARWVLINDDKRLLFLSNYDGTWQNYLSEFIDQASAGLTGIWSNVVGFPKAHFLFFGGARSEQEFKAFVRNEQVLTTVWYSAYPTLSVENVWDNFEVRQALATENVSDKDVTQCLQRL